MIKEFANKINEYLDIEYIEEPSDLFDEALEYSEDNVFNTLRLICDTCQTFKLTEQEFKYLIETLKYGQDCFNSDEFFQSINEYLCIDVNDTTNPIKITIGIINQKQDKATEMYQFIINTEYSKKPQKQIEYLCLVPIQFKLEIIDKNAQFDNSKQDLFLNDLQRKLKRNGLTSKIVSYAFDVNNYSYILFETKHEDDIQTIENVMQEMVFKDYFPDVTAYF